MDKEDYAMIFLKFALVLGAGGLYIFCALKIIDYMQKHVRASARKEQEQEQEQARSQARTNVARLRL